MLFSCRSGSARAQIGAAHQKADVPAAAFGSGLTALVVLRSLHAAGVAVYSVCPANDLAAKSRWYRAAPGLARTIPEPAQLAEYLGELRRLLAAVGYRGIFDAEFKYDARDEVHKPLEINPRPWWFVEFATRCGADLCRMSYMDALGLRVEFSQRYDLARCCVHLSYDTRGAPGDRPRPVRCLPLDPLSRPSRRHRLPLGRSGAGPLLRGGRVEGLLAASRRPALNPVLPVPFGSSRPRGAGDILSCSQRDVRSRSWL